MTYKGKSQSYTCTCNKFSIMCTSSTSISMNFKDFLCFILAGCKIYTCCWFKFKIKANSVPSFLNSERDYLRVGLRSWITSWNFETPTSHLHLSLDTVRVSEPCKPCESYKRAMRALRAMAASHASHLKTYLHERWNRIVFKTHKAFLTGF